MTILTKFDQLDESRAHDTQKEVNTICTELHSVKPILLQEYSFTPSDEIKRFIEDYNSLGQIVSRPLRV